MIASFTSIVHAQELAGRLIDQLVNRLCDRVPRGGDQDIHLDTTALGKPSPERSMLRRQPRRHQSRSRSRRRSPSRGRSSCRSRPRISDDIPPGWQSKRLRSTKDAVVVLGRNSTNKKKIELASGAKLRIDVDEAVVFLHGSENQTERARHYVNVLVANHRGEASLDLVNNRTDALAFDLPKKALAIVYGAAGHTLRLFEQESRTVIIVARGAGGVDLHGDIQDKVLVFGSDQRSRRAVQLGLLSQVELKLPHVCVDEAGTLRLPLQDWAVEDQVHAPDFGYDTLKLTQEQTQYAIGKECVTKRKIAKAGGCILEFIWTTAVIGGSKLQRQLCADYLQWLHTMRSGSTESLDFTARSDCITMSVPAEMYRTLSGEWREGFKEVEHETSTYVFFDWDRSKHIGCDNRTLVICSQFEADRLSAKTMLDIKIKDTPLPVLRDPRKFTFDLRI